MRRRDPEQVLADHFVVAGERAVKISQTHAVQIVAASERVAHEPRARSKVNLTLILELKNRLVLVDARVLRFTR